MAARLPVRWGAALLLLHSLSYQSCACSGFVIGAAECSIIFAIVLTTFCSNASSAACCKSTVWAALCCSTQHAVPTALSMLPGAADPADCFPYPLVVQDRDLRTLLEIKPPGEGGVPGGELAAAVPAAAAAAAGGEGIIVPTVHLLPYAEQPDNLVREQEPPVVQRMQDAEQPDVVGVSAAAQAASAAWRSAERAVALDPPYIRYVQVRRVAGWGACCPRMLPCIYVQA